MSCTTSSVASRLYGVKLVCRTRGSPIVLLCGTPGPGAASAIFPRRQTGPKTVLSDAEILELIWADLKASPVQSEGYPGRCRPGVKVGRPRVLRLMRENNLLSPYRGRRGTTQAPNLMWGTDDARVFIMEEG